MVLTVALEEAVLHPDYPEISTKYIPGDGPGLTPIAKKLIDIHGDRLDIMKRTGNEYQVLSLTSPGPQGEPDVAKAEELARVCNDWIAAECKKDPKHFGAFCSLSMHRPEQAAKELRRAVKELGLVGAILNDWQSTGEDGNGILLFDTPDYDPFWKEVEALGVPVYFHPKWPNDYQMKTLFDKRPWLIGALSQFHCYLSLHVQAICQGGIFDRFPGAQIIVGHLGENLPLHIWRADHHAARSGKRRGSPMAKTYDYYFKNNIFITTSGDFNTKGLLFCIDLVGVDRVLFSIDAPYEDIEEGQAWWKELEKNKVLDEESLKKVGRENAIKLMKLPLN